MPKINLDELEIRDNLARKRFEIALGDEFAFSTYERLNAEIIAFYHTEVPKSYGGQGIGDKLARYVLDYAKAHALRVAPYCPYIAAFIRRHPEYRANTVDIPDEDEDDSMF